MKRGIKLLLLSLLAKCHIFPSHSPADFPKPGAEVVFSSHEDLEKALFPLRLNEVRDRIALANPSRSFNFQIDGSIKAQRIFPLRNPGVGSVLKTEVFRTKLLSVFCPENPRVPFHAAIALNRKNIQGFSDITEEENFALFYTIKKIAEIYKTVSISGFVIAEYDTPQDGHLGRFVVEIIPHLPGFNDVKNIVDKVECNRYVLFRKANISCAQYPMSQESVLEQAAFWKNAFQTRQAPLEISDTRIEFPYTRKEAFQEEAEKLLQQQLADIFQDRGAAVSNLPPFAAEMPCHLPEKIQSIRVEKCPFCNEDVVRRQLVYEYEDVLVFYNMRKNAKEGSCFLVLPKRHTEKVYGLSASEIRHIGEVRKALAEVLKETHSGSEVIVYIQDDPSIGQTVFHSHEQVVAVDPETIALTWSMMSLFPNGNVSDEEMLQVRQEFGPKLESKLKEIQATDLNAIHACSDA